MKSERVVIACPTCTQRVRVKRSSVGTTITCPTCYQPFRAASAELMEGTATISESAVFKATVVDSVEELSSGGSWSGWVLNRAGTDPKSPVISAESGATGRLTPHILGPVEWLGYVSMGLWGLSAVLVCWGLIHERRIPLSLGIFLLLFAFPTGLTLLLVWRILFETIGLIWKQGAVSRLKPNSEPNLTER